MNNNILPLPCTYTIRHYLSRVNLKCGLDDIFMEAFKQKMEEKNSYQKHGILMFDEMQVRGDIKLNVKTMKLIGVEHFGPQGEFSSKTSERKADHALVFMFCSLANHFNQPVAVFAAKNATKGTCLAQLILVLINRLEKAGAFVDGIVRYGATTNRKMWSIFGISGKLNSHKNKIVHLEIDNRNLYFFSDVPHLIKCIQNRFHNKQKLHVSIM